MKLAGWMPYDSSSKNIIYIAGNALIFKEGQLEKSERMEQKLGIPLFAHRKVINFRTKFW